MQRAVDEPKWAWFWFGNLVALAVFCASTSYTIGYWVSEERVHAAGFALTQPIFVLCTLGALSSLLYFFTFFGVAFIYRDVEDMMARGGQGTVGRQFATPASASTSPVGANAETDCDVAIIGMGIAGASLAAVLGRQGKKVMVIERLVVAFSISRVVAYKFGASLRCREGAATFCRARTGPRSNWMLTQSAAAHITIIVLAAPATRTRPSRES